MTVSPAIQRRERARPCRQWAVQHRLSRGATPLQFAARQTRYDIVYDCTAQRRSRHLALSRLLHQARLAGAHQHGEFQEQYEPVEAVYFATPGPTQHSGRGRGRGRRQGRRPGQGQGQG